MEEVWLSNSLRVRWRGRQGTGDRGKERNIEK